MPGHVFIAQGDVTKLACDAWLLPCDADLNVESGWLEETPGERAEVDASVRKFRAKPPARWDEDGLRVASVTGWTGVGRRPWLVNVGGVRTTPPAWYAAGVRQFLRSVRKSSTSEAAFGRPKPLVALPLVGTGQGGAHAIKGDVIRSLLDVLNDEVEIGDLDVVLVTATPPALAAAQAGRKHVLRARQGATALGWDDLGTELGALARGLAREAALGELVLFLGAGVGIGAGLPTWTALLRELAVAAGLQPDERRALARLNVLDQAHLLKERLSGRDGGLGAIVARRMNIPHYALAHALLASLPVSETVTTNYDTCFEAASNAAQHPVTVLPFEPAVARRRWLLKMHGSITEPASIVLTREDYLRYASRREALAGIVQALLITRHMLFVGFSLTDDNFLRIVDAVRKAVRPLETSPRPARPFGTALLLFEDRFTTDLWRHDLDCIAMQARDPEAESATEHETAEAARRLELFLDLLLAEATSGSAHLLDPAYRGILTDAEAQLSDLLETLKRNLGTLPDEARGSPAGDALAGLLASLGATE